MATNLQLPLRRAVLALLKADSALTALVPAASIDPQGEPTAPFVLWEDPAMTPLRAACVRGATGSFDVHAFAAPRLSGGPARRRREWDLSIRGGMPTDRLSKAQSVSCFSVVQYDASLWQVPGSRFQVPAWGL